MSEAMPYDKRDEDSGQFTAEFSDEDFLQAVRDADPATTSNVADAVGCKYRTAHARLSGLRDGGSVESTEVGNSLVWSVADE